MARRKTAGEQVLDSIFTAAAQLMGAAGMYAASVVGNVKAANEAFEMGGQIPTILLEGDFGELKEHAEQFVESFGTNCDTPVLTITTSARLLITRINIYIDLCDRDEHDSQEPASERFVDSVEVDEEVKG